jgi:hypothetical protein
MLIGRSLKEYLSIEASCDRSYISPDSPFNVGFWLKCNYYFISMTYTHFLYMLKTGLLFVCVWGGGYEKHISQMQ